VYGFTDLDGSRPNMRRHMEEHYPQYLVQPPGVIPWQLGSTVARENQLIV
jgi:hypothetical protein